MAKETVVAPESVEDDWHTWSSPELTARLIRRGVDPVIAKGWVRDREHDYAVEEIEAVLTKPVLDEKDEPVRMEVPLDRRTGR